MPKIEIAATGAEPTGEMPPEYVAAARGRVIRNLTAAGGLGDFIATHAIIPPGGWSAQRHWHEGEDELVVVVAGQGKLVDDAGAHPVGPGDVAAFPKGDGNAHHFVNDGTAPLVLVAISLREASPVHYPDIGKRWVPGGGVHDEHQDD
ncbi:MAG: cupin domain-containing protein [Pseudomonadota bacterium]